MSRLPHRTIRDSSPVQPNLTTDNPDRATSLDHEEENLPLASLTADHSGFVGSRAVSAGPIYHHEIDVESGLPGICH
jgi:hypothetical protein